MVERIALSAVVLVGAFAVFLGGPRLIGAENGWPDVLGHLEMIAQRWLGLTRWVDVVVGLVSVGLLGLGIGVFREAEMLDLGTAAGFGFLGIGFLFLFSATYINGRRSRLSSAEATLLGSFLVGIVLLVAVVAVLLEI